PNSRLPKPIEKTSTGKWKALATAKWPNSWTTTRTERTSIRASVFPRIVKTSPRGSVGQGRARKPVHRFPGAPSRHRVDFLGFLQAGGARDRAGRGHGL